MSLTVGEIIMHSTLQIKIMNSEKQATGLATGFLMAFCTTQEDFVSALVTNRHVLQNAPFIQLVFTRKKADGDPDVGKTITVTTGTSGAIFHPNENIDLAILPMDEIITLCQNNNSPIFCPFISVENIPSEANWNALDVLERVVMAGYPKGLRDEKNNFPVFRSGFTATHPGYDFQGRPEVLIDMPCFPRMQRISGLSSGSKLLHW